MMCKNISSYLRIMAGLCATLLSCVNTFSQEVIELKLSHFGPLSYSQHRDVFVPWAKKIETLTNEKVKVTIFPAETLGKANEQYDLVIKGTADIACSITEFTPDRFPISSVMTLPFLGQNGEKASLVLWQLYQKYLQDEFKETKILWLFCHGPGLLHTIQKEVKTTEDLKGLRIRVANSLTGKVIERLGAIPIFCSASDGYRFLKEGKLDGVCTTWEGALNFRHLDFCKYHTEINFYTLPFFVAMNKEKYESLPPDIREIIDKNSGEEMVVLAGKTCDNEDMKGRNTAQARGDLIYSPSAAELEKWKQTTMPIGDDWVKQMQVKGLPGQEVLSYVLNLFSQIQSPHDKTIELKISHLGKDASPTHTQMLAPWARKIEILCENRIHFTIFPQETLGKASELYDITVQGNTDIALSGTEYSPGRFPLSSCMELPFLGAHNSLEATLVYWNLYEKYLKNEFKDTKVLWLYCLGMGQLHTTTKPVASLGDMKGLRIRTSDPTLGEILKRLGAVPVVSGLYEGYTLLKEGKLDGVLTPWHGAKTYGYLEFCRFHTEIDMYAVPFFVVMNKEKYESLPIDIKKIIDTSSSEEMAVLSGKIMDQTENSARQFAIDRGDFICSLTESEKEQWKKIAMPIGDEWIKKMQRNGLPGQQVLKYALNLLEQIQLPPPPT